MSSQEECALLTLWLTCLAVSILQERPPGSPQPRAQLGFFNETIRSAGPPGPWPQATPAADLGWLPGSWGHGGATSVRLDGVVLLPRAGVRSRMSLSALGAQGPPVCSQHLAGSVEKAVGGRTGFPPGASFLPWAWHQVPELLRARSPGGGCLGFLFSYSVLTAVMFKGLNNVS